MTDRLYYTHPAKLEFTATVVTASPVTGALELTLDQTAFYPEGGGQPSDRGTLNGLTVTHVHKRGSEVVHTVSGDQTIEPGEVVVGQVDRDHRHDFMQQHTGQHIVSSALQQVARANTVSVHLGDDYATVEVDRADISAAELRAVEEEANNSVMAGVPVTSEWITDSEVADYPLRRPPKVSGPIRIIRVGDIDCVPCGGVHVGNSREVRLIRLLGVERIRGHARMFWKIGDRALTHYRESSDVVERLVTLTSARPYEIVERFERQQQRLKELEAGLRREREALYRLTAGTLAAGENVSAGKRIVTAGFSGEDKEFLRGVAKEMAQMNGVAACLTNRTGAGLQWTIAIGPASGVDPSAFLPELLPLIDGKGGGRPPLWQGMGANPDGESALFGRFRTLALPGG